MLATRPYFRVHTDLYKNFNEHSMIKLDITDLGIIVDTLTAS